MYSLARLISRRGLAVAAALSVFAMLAGVALTGAQPRPIVSVSPYPGSPSVDPGASIGLTFAEDMDRASVEAALTVDPAVAGEVRWNNDREFYLIPGAPMALNTRHTARLGTTARNALGNPILTQPYSWDFTTSLEDPVIRFSYGVPIQFVSPGGGRGVPVQPGYPRLTLDVKLYSLDEPGFVTRAHGMDQNGTAGLIDVAGLPLVASFQAPIDAFDRTGAIELALGTAPGLYVIEASHARVGMARSLLVYSDYALVGKAGLEELTFWAMRMPAGDPSPGASVRVYDAAGAVIANSTSDAMGGAHVERVPGAAFAAATVAGQTTIVGMESPWISRNYYWWWDSGYTSEPPTHVGHAHTDRPIYRPGHTVHWKVTLRELEGEGYALPDPTQSVTVTIKDAMGNKVAVQSILPDGFGSLAGDFAIGPEASLGSWMVEATAGKGTVSTYFEVQEYVKPDYEVSVESDKPWYVQGGAALVTVQADYYFGQPVADADVTVRLYRSYYWRGEGSELATITGKTDADGAFTGSFTLPAPSYDSEPFVVEAEVVDASRRAVYSEDNFLVHRTDFALSLQSQRYGVDAGEPIVFEVATTNHDGGAEPDRAVTLVVNSWDWPGGYREEERRMVRTGPDGKASVSFTLPAGWFEVHATALDDHGRELTAYSWAWVMDQRYPWYWNQGLEINADKTSYAPGDTARLLIRSPVTTTALVTLEREDVVQEIVVDVAGATEIEVPITEDMAPNVWAVVHVWDPLDAATDGSQSEARLISAQVNLAVDASAHHLDVAVEPDRLEVEPGEQVTFRVSVTDAAGQPADAQLSFAVVDKAVLALTADRSGDVFDGFWRERGDSVTTYDALRPSDWYGWREGDAGGGARPPGAAGTPTPAASSPSPGGPDDEESQATPRREFPDTAFWAASVETGPDGVAEITFNVPDNLTTWRALARAVTRDTSAGQGSGELLVTKAVMADPALPRFAVQGDEFALDVLARNYSAGDLSGSCTLEAPGLTQLDPGTRNLELPVGQTRFSRWSVVASSLGTNTVTARLDTPAGGDAIELPLEVQPFAIPERFVRAGSAQTTATEAYSVPFNTVPDSSGLQVNLAPGMAVGVLQGIEDLVGYPYGCVEQTMSRLMPDAVVGRLIQELDIPPPDGLEELPAMIALGLQKIYGYQNSDGGWGWWHGNSRLYTSAYVLHGLTLVQAAGTDVDPAVLARGYAYLEGAAASPPADENDPNVVAYAHYVLSQAGRGDPSAVARFADSQSTRLDSFSLAALAIALDAHGLDAQSDAALARLKSRVSQTATTAHWPFAGDSGRWEPYYWYTMASVEKNTAMALSALSLLEPEGPLAAKAARWLMEHRSGGPMVVSGFYPGWGRGWRTTQATSYAILGLTDYLVTSGELRSNYTWTASLDGTQFASGQVDSSNVTQAMPAVTLPTSAAEPGRHELSLTVNGTGQLFYTFVGDLRMYHDGFVAAGAKGLGLSVRRSYDVVRGQKDANGWHVGDVINVRLTVEVPDEMWYLIIEDMLPAGLEPLNEALDTETGRVPGKEPDYPWRWWGYERKEIRDEKVSFFATVLYPGTHEFDYAARAVTPGTFSARPAEAYSMYRPEVWARSSSERFEIATNAVADRPILGGDLDNDCRVTDFDAALVAEAWSGGSDRDVNGDRRVDAADIALALARVGAACGDGVAPPLDSAARVRLEVRPATAAGWLEIVATGESGGADNIAAWDVDLDLPDGADASEISAGSSMAESLVIGPIDGRGVTRAGAYQAVGARMDSPVVLGRIRTTADAASVTVRRAVLASDRGAEHEVVFGGQIVSPEPGELQRVFLPKVETR